MIAAERREAPRHPAERLRARVRFADLRQLQQCYLKDLSRGGIFLRTRKPSALGAPVEVTLELPDGLEITLHGTVVHRVGAEDAAAGKPPGVGVKFSDLTPKLKQGLERLLADLPQEDGASAEATATQELVAELPSAEDGAPSPPTSTGEFKVPFQPAATPPGAATGGLAPGAATGRLAPGAATGRLAPGAATGRLAPGTPARSPSGTPRGGLLAVAAGVTEATAETLRVLVWRFAETSKVASLSYYELLGVSRQALALEICAAAEALRRALEIDRPPPGADPAARAQVAALVQLISEAESCLCDPQRRQEHDRQHQP